MIQLTYAKTGSSIADHAALNWVDLMIAEHNKHPHEMLKATVCNESVITAIRLRIVQDVIAPDQVEILFEGEQILVNRYGAIPGRWPDGFCDVTIEMSQQILRRAMEKKRATDEERRIHQLVQDQGSQTH